MKLIYLVWCPRGQDRERTASLLLDECAPGILALARTLTMHIADRDSEMRSPAPKLYPGPPVCGAVHVTLDQLTPAVGEILSEHGFEVAGYEVEESIYTDYGGNAHSGPRTWPDGQRSPGIVALTLMQRPRRLDREEWIRRWHGRMSPVSERIQPRARYVRNLVLDAITPGAPPFEGIVEEAWPSKIHVMNPYLFYGARSTIAVNMTRILSAVLGFLELTKIRTTMMSEYFLRT
jgi:hypothetical protein